MESKNIRYRFKTDDGNEHYFSITIHNQHMVHPVPDDAPAWTSLDFQRCEGCQWNATNHCPVAVRLVKPAEEMGKLLSHQQAEITVETPERTYMKKTDVQEGMSSMLGLLMATSGCPSFEALRPAAWFHLPFASIDETLYRIASMWLLGRYFRGMKTVNPADLIDEVKPIYEEIGRVNRAISKRWRAASVTEKDAPLNAVTILDSLAFFVPMSIKDGLEDLRVLFSNS